MWREIPEGSVEVQTGLWLYTYTKIIAGNTYTFRKLYSAEVYCFWQVSQPENYDEEGNLLPENQRVYATYSTCALTTVDEINAEFISVPYTEGYEVVSVGNGTVTE
jgi:hypothetical protein